MQQQSSTSPRVNGETIRNYIGKAVRVLGEIDFVDSNTSTVTLRTSDNQRIRAVLSNLPPNFTCKYLEVIGKVNNDLSVSEYSTLLWGDDIGNTFIFKMRSVDNYFLDLDNYNQLVKLTQNFPEIF
jgi:hypothetical protein